MKTTFAIRVHRVGQWWAIEVPELGVHTQARRLDQVEEMARDAIAATLDMSAANIELGVQIRLRDDLEHEWYAVQGARQQATNAQLKASRLTEEFVRRLVEDEGLRVRELAVMLGVSHQRVSQLLKASAERRAFEEELVAWQRAKGAKDVSTSTDASGVTVDPSIPLDRREEESPHTSRRSPARPRRTPSRR